MSISYPTYNDNYPKSTRKIKKQYISYRGKINTQKINAQYINFQYESPLERDFITILVHDLNCVEIIPQAIFNISDEKGKFHKYSIDIWSLYKINKRWIVYLYEVKPEEMLEKLNKSDNNWNIRIKSIKLYCRSMNEYLSEKGLNVEWRFKIISEKEIYSIRFSNIQNFTEDSLRVYDKNFIKEIISCLNYLYEDNDLIIYLDLIRYLEKKLEKTTKISIYLIRGIVNYFIYNQILWIDWERRFIESESLISYNKSNNIKLRPSYDIIPVYFEKESYKSKIVRMSIDMDNIDKKLITEARRKLMIIKPLIDRQAIKLLTGKDVNLIAKQENVSSRTIYKWISKYVSSNNDIRSLIIKNQKKGNRSLKLNFEVENIIKLHINNNCKCCKVLSTKKRYYENIKLHCEKENLDNPSYTTVKDRIRKLPAKERKGKQGGFIKNEIQKSIVGELDRGNYPLHFVQVDSTWLDIFVIDEFDGKSKRPFITLYLDVKTRMIYSYWITLREHNAVDVNRGLMRAFLPKDELMKRHNLTASYPIYGIPYRIQFDNGKIFDTKYVEDFCFKFGVADYQFRMVKRADTGGFVERLIGTINKSWLSNSDGYAPPVKNRPVEYDPQKHKNLMTFTEFQKWILLRIFEYHNTPHEGLFRDMGLDISPITMYLAEMKGREPILPDNYAQMEIDVLHFKNSVLNAEGIKFYHNNYNIDGVNSKGKRNNYLARIRTSGRGEKKKVLWRYDPEDIREIWVYNDWVDKPFYFSVKFSTGLLKLFIEKNPDIPIPLRVYNKVRENLRKEGEKREKKPEVVAIHIENKLLSKKQRKNIINEKKQTKIEKNTTDMKKTNKAIDWDKIKPLESWIMK